MIAFSKVDNRQQGKMMYTERFGYAKYARVTHDVDVNI